MGVRGLTTFIKNNEWKYLRNHKLHNCTLILDGNSIASNLFIGSNTESAFGGDYDKFAKYVKEFFKLLLKCDIKLLVIFDGGYEERKLKTVYSRLKDKFRSSRSAQPVTGSLNFPLFMRIVFREVLTELKIPFAQSDYEADDEIAALARQLECPVLSYDSDFYIYDVLYIPFPSLCLEPVAFNRSESHGDKNRKAFYLNCKIYKVDVLIDSFGGLDKSMLPLLAALLGNDYIKRSVFKAFYNNLKIPKGKTNHLQRRIKAVIEWLRNETFESAVRKILGRMKKRIRRGVMRKMRKIVNGYVQCSSILSEHLEVYDHNNKSTTKKESVIVNIIEKIDENIESIGYEIECEDESVVEKSFSETSSEDSDEEVAEENSVTRKEELNISQYETECNEYPNWLLVYARKGRIQSCVMDIISLRQHFFIPQVEDYSLPSAHCTSLKIFSAIVGILLGTSKPDVKYWTRNGSSLNRFTIEPITETESLKFPPSNDIIEINESIRKSALLDIAEATVDLSELPEEWHLFVIAAIFWLKNMTQPMATEFHLHTIVMCIICIYTIDLHIGVHRNKQSFMRKYKNYLNKVIDNRNRIKESIKEEPKTQTVINDIRDPKTEFINVTHEDCVVVFESILPYHHLSEQIKTKPKSFCLSTVHAFSQFQSCLFYVIVLNSVLNFPFKETIVSKLFSGTFAYNMFTNLSKRNNLNAYVEGLFQSCPSLLKLYKALIHYVQSTLSGTHLSSNPLKKQRKKKKQSKQSATVDLTTNKIEECEELFLDENNRFSKLSVYAQLS